MPRGIEHRLQRLEKTHRVEKIDPWRVYVTLDDALNDTYRGKKYVGCSPDDWDTQGELCPGE